MRDLVVAFIVFASVPLILRRPSIGIVMWCWISYMNPHRLAWGFAYDFPFALLIAVCTLAGLVFSSEDKQIPRLTGTTALWLGFFIWVGLTTLFAVYPDRAMPKFIDFSKVQLMTLITIVVMRDRHRMNLLVWAIVVSIGFYGIKGGIFTLMTGGDFRVWGPARSYIQDNNALALALYMLLPLVYYLRSQSEKPWIRNGLLVVMGLIAVSAVGSYSRGGFLAGLSMAGVLWLKSRSKIVTGSAVALMIPLLLVFMPEGWHTRMSTIRTYDQDRSAMNRIEAWTMCYNAANHRPLGGGFGMWSPDMYRLYGPLETGKAPGTRGAHSIYFSVLGEHGWIGLLLFVSVFVAAWRTASWIVRHTRGVEELEWIADLSRMVQVSLVAYATGGAFQSLSYFDLPWHLLAIVVSGRLIVERALQTAHEDVEEDVPDPSSPRMRMARAGGATGMLP